MLNYLNFFNEDATVALSLVVGIIASGAFGILWLLILLISIFVLLVWFYRSPIINLPYHSLQSDEIYSPAYGVIEKIEHIDDHYKIAIALSLSDIHIQYYPTIGEVINQIRTPFTVSTIMKNIMWGQPARIIKITQRTGYIARRIATPETRGAVCAGQRLGMIKFGSHVDLEIPDKYQIIVRPGDRVNGPYSKLAKWI